jgi:hypothetical protein
MNPELLCNYKYDNELNEKINKRYFPSKEIQPNFDPRPLSTKYSVLSLHPNNKIIHNNNIDLRNYHEFDTHKIFYSGNRKPPVSYFFDNINIESNLRNQNKILNKYNNHSYFYNEDSDLYKISPSLVENTKEKYKFLDYRISGMNPKKCNLETTVFFNTTRTNVKNL